MLASALTALVMAHSATAWHGHSRPKADCCVTCGVETADVVADLCLLQTSPRWFQRERAAHRLRRVEWRCHPDVVGALTYAMLHDCNGEVREESAESLADLAPCDAAVHQAFLVSATCDPKLCTRLQAKRGLKKLNRLCTGPCGVCAGTLVVSPSIVVPMPVQVPMMPAPAPAPAPGGEPLLEPIGPAGVPVPSNPPQATWPAEAVPPDLPPAALGASPFRLTLRTPAIESDRPKEKERPKDRRESLLRRLARGPLSGRD